MLISENGADFDYIKKLIEEITSSEKGIYKIRIEENRLNGEITSLDIIVVKEE